MADGEWKVFSDVYINNVWGSKESASGTGSELWITALLREKLGLALQQLNIKTFLDAPCGDLNWVKLLQHDFDRYIGIDIVTELIDHLRAGNTRPNYHFQVNNIVTDILPAADALFCRDCLVHFPFAMIDKAVQKIKLSGCKYLLTTTFPDHPQNIDIKLGEWRTLNFCTAPFNWPAPKILIAELPEDMVWEHRDKSIGVWEIADIPN